MSGSFRRVAARTSSLPAQIVLKRKAYAHKRKVDALSLRRNADVSRCWRLSLSVSSTMRQVPFVKPHSGPHSHIVALRVMLS